MAVMLAAVPLLAVAGADGAALLARHTATSHSAPASTPRHGQSTAADRRAAAAVAAAQRTTAIRGLLGRRADAVLTRDRAEWRATLDPEHPAFLRTQMQV